MKKKLSLEFLDNARKNDMFLIGLNKIISFYSYFKTMDYKVQNIITRDLMKLKNKEKKNR